ncbi:MULTISPECIES: hypothetical protein [Mycobacteroides]|nr:MULTISPECIES: hypothetical protein [Mycobacteroides]
MQLPQAPQRRGQRQEQRPVLELRPPGRLPLERGLLERLPQEQRQER